MKISKVLLRWHKSFNVNYRGYEDRGSHTPERPWNALFVPDGTADDHGFIEIPVEPDVTTIVGANESGKSHLLDAICKVLKGYGNDDRPQQDKAFSVIDLCHFSLPSKQNKNTGEFPNIGLAFTEVGDEEAGRVLDAAAQGATDALKKALREQGFVLIVAPESDAPAATQARLYVGSQSFPLHMEQLTAVRGCLPKVRFLRSDLPLADEVPLRTLIAAYDGETHIETYEPNTIFEVATELRALITPPNPAAPADFMEKVQALQHKVAGAQIDQPSRAKMEAMLFRDVLGIEKATLEKLVGLKTKARSFIESKVSLWNETLREELNLSRYWQQDPSFALRINLKHGVIFFEITDKTGAIYTFGERSSGLRYFLSYYIQAKALEKATSEGQSIILMDEPDSFLSTQGQRNLLMVFESLVSATLSRGNTQLLYTTHSPWLINRNFPQRLRLVRKGEAEEGTQYIQSPAVRRYEPVRSALGVDCSQTLFMGATNLVLEGVADQFLLTEAIRCFATPSTIHRFLDLNSLVTVSADSVDRIDKVLSASQWGDEIPPATVVLVDADDAGIRARERLTRPRPRPEENSKKTDPALISEKFVVTVADILGESLGEEGRAQKVVTTEDLVPLALYVRAALRYVQHWHSKTVEGQEQAFRDRLKDPQLGAAGVAEGVKKVFQQFEVGQSNKFDKVGIAQEVVHLVREHGRRDPRQDDAEMDQSVKELEERLQRACAGLQSRIDQSEQNQRTQTGEATIRLALRQFCVGRRQASVREMIRLFERIGRKVELLGTDGEKLQATVSQCAQRLQVLENAGQEVLEGDFWSAWQDVLNNIQRHPLNPTIAIPESKPLHEPGGQEPQDLADGTAPDASGAGKEKPGVAKPRTAKATN